MKLGMFLGMFSILCAGLGAQERLALVIGNSDYATLPRVATAGNDAADLAGVLTDLGFKVRLLKNADLNAMDIALLQFGADLETAQGSYGFFYFAGHGVASLGQNYLIPSDAAIDSEQDLANHALAFNDVLDTVHQAHNPLNLIVLDASRPNPFRWGTKASRGLTAFGHQPEGTLVCFSAAPGAVTADSGGRNGLFVSGLMKNLTNPDLDVKEVLNATSRDVMRGTSNAQVPVVYSQYFQATSLSTPRGAPVEAPSPQEAPVVVFTPSTERLGTPGPGGGTIIFNKGNDRDGWQYLEVAPEDLEAVPWFNGKDGVATGANETTVGSGKDNTTKILAILGKGTYAASACVAYDGGGFHDWFLPSKDELLQVFKVLGQGKLGKFSKFTYYWSSSEKDSSDAWVQNLGDGGQYDNLKGFKHLVRPVRAF